MEVVSKFARLLFYVLIAIAIPRCSADPSPYDPPTAPSVATSIKPVDPIRMDLISETEPRSIFITPVDAGMVVNFISTNPSVATVSPGKANNALNMDGIGVLVEAVNFGTAKLHIDAAGAAADVPISVWPSGTWKGSVFFQGACLGSDAAYGETVQFDVNDSGVGMLTVTDTKGFNRPYSITIPSPLTFTSDGTFLYNNGFTTQNVPGRIKVTLQGNLAHYEETTDWGSCSNTYIGDLAPSS